MFPLTHSVATGLGREALYRPLVQMMEKVSTMFDLCNGKEGNNMWLSFNQANGETYAKKFLDVLRWFLRWERGVREAGHLDVKRNFIAPETLKAVKYVCLGFACLIQYECIEGGRRLSPSKLNQDICEHHFANVRRSVASHSNPNEVECMAGVVKSAFLRMEDIKKGNCLPQKQECTATTLKRVSHLKNRQTFKKRRKTA